MPSTLLVRFLISVALAATGVLALALLFALAIPWLQRCLKSLLGTHPLDSQH